METAGANLDRLLLVACQIASAHFQVVTTVKLNPNDEGVVGEDQIFDVLAGQRAIRDLLRHDPRSDVVFSQQT